MDSGHQQGGEGKGARSGRAAIAGATKGNSGCISAARRAQVSSLVRETVEKLREFIVYADRKSDFLGSEDQLLAALGVSRPTFRQAARLLEHEQLLFIKRGVGGGVFARKPSADGVVHATSVLLMAQGASLRSMAEACGPLIAEAARLLAANPSPEVRGVLAEYAMSRAGVEPGGDPDANGEMVLGFTDLLARLCGNPVIDLMVGTITRIAREPRHRYYQTTREHAAVYADYHRRLVAAVLDGRPDEAFLIAQRHMRTIVQFLPDTPRPGCVGNPLMDLLEPAGA